MHTDLKTAMQSKVQTLESVVQDKTSNIDKWANDSKQLQHKNETLESRLEHAQTEMKEATRKYDELHSNFVQKVIMNIHKVVTLSFILDSPLGFLVT